MKKQYISRGILSVLLVFLLGGCAARSQPTSVTIDTSRAFDPSKPLTRTMRDIEKINRELLALRKANRVDTETIKKRSYQPTGVLAENVRFDHVGTLQNGLEKIAESTRLELNLVNPSDRMSEIIVHSDPSPRTLHSILRDLGNQAEGRATITLHPSRNVMDLEYTQ